MPGRTRKDERSALKRSIRFLGGLRAPAAPIAAAALVRGGSDAWAIRGSGRRTWLFHGPQLGFEIPELLADFEVHRPGLAARGVMPPGLPSVGIGRNTGTGSAEWRGFLKVSQRPHVINPRQVWLANWNNVPSVGWTTGDAPDPEPTTGRLHRAKYLFRLVRRAARAPSYDAVKAVDRVAGTRAQQRPLLGAQVCAAASGATGPAKALLDTVVAWDGPFDRTDATGTVDRASRRGRRSRTPRCGRCPGRRAAGSAGPASATSSTSGSARPCGTASVPRDGTACTGGRRRRGVPPAGRGGDLPPPAGRGGDPQGGGACGRRADRPVRVCGPGEVA